MRQRALSTIDLYVLFLVTCAVSRRMFRRSGAVVRWRTMFRMRLFEEAVDAGNAGDHQRNDEPVIDEALTRLPSAHCAARCGECTGTSRHVFPVNSVPFLIVLLILA